MAVSIEDIIKKEFAHSFMGYDMQEVDVFLDAVIERLEKMELERGEMTAAMERLLKKVDRLEKALAAKANEQPAIEEAEPPARKLSSGGPVRVQGTRFAASGEAIEKLDPRAERPASATQPRVRRPVPHATQAPAAAPAAPAEPTAAAQVAVEIETGVFAPDPKTLIPDLISGVEEAILDRVVRAASRAEERLNADQSRVS